MQKIARFGPGTSYPPRPLAKERRLCSAYPPVSSLTATTVSASRAFRALAQEKVSGVTISAQSVSNSASRRTRLFSEMFLETTSLQIEASQHDRQDGIPISDHFGSRHRRNECRLQSPRHSARSIRCAEIPCGKILQACRIVGAIRTGSSNCLGYQSSRYLHDSRYRPASRPAVYRDGVFGG